MPRTKKLVEAMIGFDEAHKNEDILIGTRFQDSPNMDGFIKVIGVKDDNVELLVTDRKTGMRNNKSWMTHKTVKHFMDMYGYSVDAPQETIDPIETDDDDESDDDDGEIDIETISDRELLAMKHDMTLDQFDKLVDTVENDYVDYEAATSDLVEYVKTDLTPSDDDDGDDDDGDDDDDTTETPSTSSDLDIAIRSSFDLDKLTQRIGGTVDNDIAAILFTTMAMFNLSKNETISMAISLLATSDKTSLKKALSNVYLSRLNTSFPD